MGGTETPEVGPVPHGVAPFTALSAVEVPTDDVAREALRRFATVLTEAAGSGVLVVAPGTGTGTPAWLQDLASCTSSRWTVAIVGPDTATDHPDLLSVASTEDDPLVAGRFLLAVGTDACGVLTSGSAPAAVASGARARLAWTCDPTEVADARAALLVRLRARATEDSQRLAAALDSHPLAVADIAASERFSREILGLVTDQRDRSPDGGAIGDLAPPRVGPSGELDQHTQLVAVGRSAAAFAHELNNQTFAIGMATELIRGALGAVEGSVRDTLTVQTELIAEQVQRIAAMARAMLEFTRTARVEPRPVELAAWLVRVAAELTDALGHTVMAAAPQAVDTVTDPDRLRDALLPLVVNATEADPDRAPVVLRLVPAAGGHSIDVIDRGVGVAPEVRAEMFVPFVGTKAGRGSGLGLTLARRYADLLGGAVELHDTDDEGSTFRLWLPSHSAREGGTPRPGSRSQPVEPGGGERPRRVLVLDDAEAVRTTVAALLRRIGLAVEAVEDAAAAERCVTQAPVDLFIADLHFAADVSLAELLERLEQLQGDVRRRTVVITGDLPSAVPSLGVACVLSKPFGRVELEAVVADVLA